MYTVLYNEFMLNGIYIKQRTQLAQWYRIQQTDMFVPNIYFYINYLAI